LSAGREVDFAELSNVHIPAAMLKSFLRQLPEPLLTYELYDHIVRVQCMYHISAAYIPSWSNFWHMYSLHTVGNLPLDQWNPLQQFWLLI